MRCRGHYSSRDLADVLGCSPGAVRARLYRARISLADARAVFRWLVERRGSNRRRPA